MRILVTGGAGFIGSNLVRTLNRVSPNSQITVFDDLSTGLSSNLVSCAAEFQLGSILDYPVLRKLVQPADIVIHLAAIGSVPRSVESPRHSHEANATGTLNVLEAARESGKKQVIVASSSSVYGANPSLPKRELDWTRPLSPYGVSKLATESYTLAYGHTYGLEVLPLRFFNVYGPQQRADHAYAAVIPKFVSRALSNLPVEIYGDGQQTRDFTFVDDVSAIIAQSVSGRISSDSPINLAFGTRHSLLDLVETIGEELGREIEIQFRPARASDVRDSSGDDGLLKETFSGIMRTNLRDGIRRTIEWFKSSIVD